MINVETWDESTQGPLSEKTLTLLLEKKGYQVCKYVYPPGTFFSDHSHAVDKIDAVLVGQFEMNMKGMSVILGPGDSLEVPRGQIHSARVVGSEAVVSLDAVKS